MKAEIVRIGNSRGIRIPKKVIEHCGFHGAVDIDVRDGELVIRATTQARKGWDEAFRRMHQCGDDALHDPDGATTEWDKSEWRW
jgi:antitoxin MazE